MDGMNIVSLRPVGISSSTALGGGEKGGRREGEGMKGRDDGWKEGGGGGSVQKQERGCAYDLK